MKTFILLVLPFFFLSCKNVQIAKPSAADENNTPVHRYSDAGLVTFLDSIGSLDPETLNGGIKTYSDSIFNSYNDTGYTISIADFEALKKEDPDNITNLELLKRLFPKEAEYIDEDTFMGIVIYHFSESKFEKFAVEFPGGIGSSVYFFSGNKILARHSIYHKYGLELNSFINSNGKTVIYYKVNYLSGTDIFHDNYNFYMYTDDSLIPVLNELESSNLGHSWTLRSYWLESTITGTDPLAIKMVYEQNVPYPDDNEADYIIVKDSAIVKYNWDNSAKHYIPDFSGTNLDSNVLLSYYLAYNELLFINTHYQKLKATLQGSDIPARKAVLNYLDIIKGTYSQKEKR